MISTTPGNYLIYNGINSREYGVFISGTGVYDAPQRDIETVAVPGRNGEVIFDNGRFMDIDVIYPCYIPRGFEQKFQEFKAAIMADTGFHKLEDTYNPEYFREGYVVGPITPETGPLNRSGKFDLTFRCKPQRYLVSGQRTVNFTTTGDIINPTRYPARPLIQISGAKNGSGMLDFTNGKNNYNVLFNDNVTGTMYLDSETGNAYYENTSGGSVRRVPLNNKILTQPSGFPQLLGGTTRIAISGDVTRIAVLPRWWQV